jgi:histidinol-phosphatase (PHP family)
LIDLHSHHYRCGHADDTMEAMARAAHAAGVTVFGWSDHTPLFAHPEDHPDPGTQMAKSSWDAYLAEAVELRERLTRELPGFDLRIGAEADYLPGTAAAYRAGLDRPELDYVLGSVHMVDSWHIYRRATHGKITDPDEAHRKYWQATREAAQSGLFDILAHMDAIKARVPAALSDMSREIEETLDCIADTGIAVEINSAGLRKTTELFPSLEIVAGLVRRGVPITYGSDSHKVAEVAFGYEQAARLLMSLGRTEWVTFRGREAEWREIKEMVASGALRNSVLSTSCGAQVP